MQEEHPAFGEWDAGFEAGRRLVVSRLGPFVRVFERPRRYVKFFHHSLHELQIEDWSIQVEKKILGGFCNLGAALTIRFQPTLRYVEENVDALPDLTGHIKRQYGSLLIDTVEQELLRADDGTWVEEGMDELERQIAMTINETLAIQNIRCRTHCAIEPVFESIEIGEMGKLTGNFRHEQACLEIMRRNFAFREKQEKERLRQEQMEREARRQHELALLEQQRRDEQRLREREAYETARLKAELEEMEKREAERLRSEERISVERMKLANKIKQMEMAMAIEDRKLRYQATEEADELVRREIELLVLEKQRSALGRELKQVGHDADF